MIEHPVSLPKCTLYMSMDKIKNIHDVWHGPESTSLAICLVYAMILKALLWLSVPPATPKPF